MNIRQSLASPIFLFLLLAGMVTSAVSAFLFIRIDNIVHTVLYRYGLQFSYEWAGQYWSYSSLTIIFLAVSLAITSVLAVFILVKMRTRETNSIRSEGGFLLVIAVVLTGFSAGFFNRVDDIVRNELYKYGLQFNFEWAGQYWIYTDLSTVLQAATLVMWSVSIVLLFKSTQPIALLEGQEMGSDELTPASVPPTLTSSSSTCSTDQNIGAEVAHELEELRRKVWSYKRLPTRLAGYGLTIVGAVIIVCSMIFSFSVWAMVGLVLTFWGVFFFFLKPTSFVKAELLDSAAISLHENMRRLVAEFGLKGKGVYLPPRYLKDLSGGLVFVSANEETYVPTMDEVGEVEDRVFLGNPNGLCLVPSGVALVNLFEKELGTSFAKVDLAYLERNLPKVFIEALEIAEDIELSVDADSVHVRIEGSIYRGLCHEIKRLSGVCESFGCPLCSSIACALARASGNPVVMDGNEQSQNGKVVDVCFRVLEE